MNIFERLMTTCDQKTAVDYKGDKLTYGEMKSLAKVTAQLLYENGVVEGDLVAVDMNRTPSVLATILALWKIGAVYIPLNPRQSALAKSKIITSVCAKFMISDRPVAINTDKVKLIEFPVWENFKMFKNKTIQKDVQLCATEEHTAYMIFTSGTTGEPKGISVTHANISNYLTWCAMCYTPSELRRCLVAGSLTFDISLMEILATWYHQGTIILVESVLDLLTTNTLEPSAIFATPSGFSEVVKKGALPESAEVITLGGEILPKPLAKRILKSNKRLINAYGPSEATILATYHEVTNQSLDFDSIPIGKPIPNTNIRILKPDGADCEIGEVGELVIYGESVSQGYVGSAVDQKNFGFDIDRKEKYYKSGDLAFYNSEGFIEIKGRRDGQIKLRGFRVDLRGLEASFDSLEGVAMSAFVYEKNTSGGILHTFVLLDQHSSFDKNRALDQFRLKHPEYCIPNKVHVLNSFPSTANGKLDRPALLLSVQESEKLASRAEDRNGDGICAFIVRYLQGALQDNAISSKHNFHEIGCNSLLAMRLALELKDRYAYNIPFGKLLDLGTPQNVETSILEYKKVEMDLEDFGKTPNEPAYCSVQQKSLIYHNRTHLGDDAQYNEYYAFELSKNLNELALIEAMCTVIKKHEVLNGRFNMFEDSFVIEAMEDSLNGVTVIDVGSASQNQIMKRIHEEIRLGFDLFVERPVRGTLLRSDSQYYLVIVIHHVAFDGLSEEIFYNDFTKAYRTLVQKNEPHQNDQAVSYFDYCKFEREYLSNTACIGSENYWAKNLSLAPLVHSIHLDHSRSLNPAHRGDRLSKFIPQHIADKLKSICHEQHVTPFTGLYASLALALAKYSGEKQICIGTPMANRSQLRFMESVGFFVNTVPLNADFTHVGSFEEALSYCNTVLQHGKTHQAVPFSRMLELTDTKRDTSFTPFVQLMLIHEIENENLLQLEKCSVRRIPLYNQTTQFDITFIFKESSAGIQLVAEYDIDLFDAYTIESILTLYSVLLTQYVQRPQAPASIVNVPVTLENKIEDTCDLKPNETIMQLFNKTVDTYGSNIAVSMGTEQITYEALSTQVENFAQYLLHEQVKKHDTVCIYMNRSIDRIIALLAVLKCHAVFLPLDKDIPEDRLAYVCKKANVKLILSDEDITVESIPVGVCSVETVNSQTLWAEQVFKTPRQPAQGSDLAYVLFTSGTTGEPKGAQITHDSLCQHVHSAVQQYNLSNQSVTLQYVSSSFDVSVSDIFCSLLSGGRLHLIDQETLYSSKALSREIVDYQITHMNITPASLSTIELRNDYSLKSINVGGEVCSEELLEAWGRVCELYISYGPTECTVCTSSIRASEKTVSGSIGFPIGSSTYYVCDALGNHLPKGTPGYLYITGPQVMAGYVGSQNTGVSTIKVEQKKIRAYNSLDIVRQMPNGEYQFLGRKDNLVKINGHRIALSELSERVKEAGLVTDAVPLVYKRTTNVEVIVLFVVPKDKDAGDSQKRVMDRLKKFVPQFMLPWKVIPVETIPITQNGKINYPSLEMKIENEDIAIQEHVLTDMEEQVYEIWCTLLDAELPKQNDVSFYTVGGNSLTFIKLINRIHMCFNVDFSISEMTPLGTIKLQADAILMKKESLCVHYQDLESFDSGNVEEW